MPICAATATLARAGDDGSGGGYPRKMSLVSRMRSAMASESRRADEEAAAVAAERIRSGAADHDEDGAEALASLGISLPEG